MMEKIKKNNTKDRKTDKGPKGKYGDKQWGKIVAKSRPTRSMLITKSWKGKK